MILSAGIIVVRRVEGEYRYLLLRAYNYWDFPKGEVEEDESPFEAAQREVKEETGLTNLSFPWSRIFKETSPYSGRRKRARYYLAETDEAEIHFSVNPEIGRPEHHEYRWLPADDLKKLVPARLYPVIDWVRRIIES